MSFSREMLVYMSKISEETERYEDMIKYMRQVVKFGQDLNIEERTLLHDAYKNAVITRRSAWRQLQQSITQNQYSDVPNSSNYLKDYQDHIASEIRQFCDEILKLIEVYILGNCKDPESLTFFLKMLADYYRYIAEFSQDQEYKNASQSAVSSYKKATQIAEQNLKTTNNIRLGIALNYSIFCYEVLKDNIHACNLAKTAFDDAMEEIEGLGNSKEDQKSRVTIQILKNNLDQWTDEMGRNMANEIQI